MRQKTDKEIEQETKLNEMWLDRWEAEHIAGEDLITCTARLNHEQQMRLLWGMIKMFENKPNCEHLLEQAQHRYQHYSAEYDQGKYQY